jgi:hypothetical protein
MSWKAEFFVESWALAKVLCPVSLARSSVGAW